MAGSLVGFAVLKLTSGHQQVYWLPAWAFYGIAFVESMGALAFVFHRALIGVAVTMAIAFFGGLYALVERRAPCGCLGSVALSWREHALICFVLGLLSATVLWCSTGREKWPRV
jgi:hypothetical protein